MSLQWLLLGEGSLVVLALVWCWLRDISIPYRWDLADWGISLAAAAGFALGNLGLYHLGRRTGRPAAVHAFLETEIFPLFRGVPVYQLILLSAVAGVGEELLFRGAVQEELGIGMASIFFGLLHGPTRELWPLALWATAMGLLLGILYQASGNLLVPALSHALYDGAALIYLSRREGLDSMKPVSEQG